MVTPALFIMGMVLALNLPRRWHESKGDEGEQQPRRKLKDPKDIWDEDEVPPEEGGSN